jgi:hypothetical protein
VHEIGDALAAPVLGERALSAVSLVGVENNKAVGYRAGSGFLLELRDPTLPFPPVPAPSVRMPCVVDAAKVFVRRGSAMIEVSDLYTNRLLQTLDLSSVVLRERDRIALFAAQDQRLYVVVSDEINSRYEVLVFEFRATEFLLVGRHYVEGDPWASVRGILIEDRTLFVVIETDGGAGLVDAVDVTKPHRPNLLSRTAINRPNGKLIQHKGYAYAGSSDGLVTIDVRNREAPVTTSVNSHVGFMMDLAAKHNLLYVMRSAEMMVLDLVRPGHPTLIASRAHGSRNQGVALLATDSYLLAIRSEGVEALPFHAAQR